MLVGVYHFPTDYGIDPGELASAVEARGFESLFVCEHTHIPVSRRTPFPSGGELPKRYKHTHDPFVALSFAAAATRKLVIGTGICLIAQRDPIVTAKSVASLDRLAGGRFVFGVGGWPSSRGAWEHASLPVERVRFDPVWPSPKPAQRPHPPILLGGESDHTLKRVVEFCDGWFPRFSAGFNAKEAVGRLRHIVC